MDSRELFWWTYFKYSICLNLPSFESCSNWTGINWIEYIKKRLLKENYNPWINRYYYQKIILEPINLEFILFGNDKMWINNFFWTKKSGINFYFSNSVNSLKLRFRVTSIPEMYFQNNVDYKPIICQACLFKKWSSKHLFFSGIKALYWDYMDFEKISFRINPIWIKRFSLIRTK